nr:MAG TPA: hypothetical protein [Caudoviricetes sp.]
MTFTLRPLQRPNTHSRLPTTTHTIKHAQTRF